jgi:mannose-6-phosphate isomerase
MLAPGPLLLTPELDEKPWGGRGLAGLGFDLPEDRLIGEALITGSDARITGGVLDGMRLGDIVAADPPGAIGERGLRLTNGLPLFPLLIKLIDARDDLSIQVHPADETAPHGHLGKTEAWYVLSAQPGSWLYLGLQDGVDTSDLEALARSGQSTAHLMRRVPATPGTTVLLPAGTVHALGAGVLIYEIQQPSAITYRFDDWGRVDAAGNPRELHIDEGFGVLDPLSRPEPIFSDPVPTTAGKRSRLVRCPFFAAERIELGSGQTVELDGKGAPQVFTTLAGWLTVAADGHSVLLNAGQSVALLAASSPAVLTATEPTTLIRGWLDPASEPLS